MTNLIADIKNFWNARPCNIKHSNKPIGSLEYFEEVKNKRYYVEPHIKEFAQFDEWKDKSVLELGCGIGTDSIEFAKAGANITITDISENSIDIAKQRFNVYGYPVQAYVGNLEDLSSFVPLKKYDLIYSFGVIHHTEFPEQIIEQIKKYCHSETIIKIMLYNKFSWKAFSFFLSHGWRFGFNFNKTIEYFAEAQTNCPRALTYTKGGILRLFKDYEIISLQKDHIFVYDIPSYINGEYKKTIFFKLLPNSILSYLKKTFGWHYLITAKIKNV
jgi:2-polyprenyl-3-methyl-5-hydroxy-6-metoxy-1,4-benzoquinol methylase